MIQIARGITLLLLMLPLTGVGQSNGPFRVQRIAEPPVVDGLSNEPAWETVVPLPLAMHSPIYLGEPTERTEIRIAYDDEYIYVSGRFYDSEPQGIQANSIVRDVDRGGDFFNILLDTFNDKQNFVGFFTTPGGNRLDREVQNDAENADPNDFHWNSYWDCEVVQNEEGWFAEMRIPFSSLRFQDDNGRVIFGLTAHRLIARKNERLTFPAIPPKQPVSAFKASQAKEVVFEGIVRENPVYVTPYALAGRSTWSTPSFLRQTSQELGLDVKYGFATNMTLDLSINTDFAQVEADDQQINLTRFSLFYPERRQFFQERSGVFDFRYGGVNRLFHSRKIGLTDNGEPVRILGGARLVGRAGAWDAGVIDMHTDGSPVLPSENFNVVRFRRNILNKDSYIGVMETGRISRGGAYNVGLGIDNILRLSDADYLLLHYIHGFRNTATNGSFLDQSVLSADWQRRTAAGFGGGVRVTHIGERYDPGIGFNLRNGGTEARGQLVYGFFTNENQVIRKHTGTLSAAVFLRNSNRSKESAEWGASWFVDFKSGASMFAQMDFFYEDLRDTLRFSDGAAVLPGSYSFPAVTLSYAMSPGVPLRTSIAVRYGRFYDGVALNVTAGPTWNCSRFLELGADYEYNQVRFTSRGERLDASILRFRALGAVNHRLSATALVQYSTLANTLGNAIRFRYNLREGSDIYLVYNNAMWVDRHRNGLNLPAIDRSTLIAKFVYTIAS